METLQSNHHFSIASAVETAKIKERDLLRSEMKQMANLNVSVTGVFSATCFLLFFITNRICYNQARVTKLQASIDKEVVDNKVLVMTVAELNATVSKQRMELEKEKEDKLANTKVINIDCQLSIGTGIRPHHTTTAEDNLPAMVGERHIYLKDMA